MGDKWNLRAGCIEQNVNGSEFLRRKHGEGQEQAYMCTCIWSQITSDDNTYLSMAVWNKL